MIIEYACFRNGMANSVDPDDTAREPSHLDLRCLQIYLLWFAGIKGLSDVTVFYDNITHN